MWKDLDYLDDETNASRRRVAGLHCHPGGPELTEEIAAAVHGVSAPGMTPDAGARRFPYRREPYGRARIPTDLGDQVVDGKVLMTEDGPLLELWRKYAGGRILDVLIPRAWVEPIGPVLMEAMLLAPTFDWRAHRSVAERADAPGGTVADLGRSFGPQHARRMYAMCVLHSLT